MLGIKLMLEISYDDTLIKTFAGPMWTNVSLFVQRSTPFALIMLLFWRLSCCAIFYVIFSVCFHVINFLVRAEICHDLFSTSQEKRDQKGNKHEQQKDFSRRGV